MRFIPVILLDDARAHALASNFLTTLSTNGHAESAGKAVDWKGVLLELARLEIGTN